MELYFGEDRARMKRLALQGLEMARRVDDAVAVGYALNMVFALEDGLDKLRPRPFYREIRGKRLREQL